MSVTTLLLSLLVVLGSLALAWYLWQRLLSNAERLKELHEDLARNEREMQRRMIEAEAAITQENKKD